MKKLLTILLLMAVITAGFFALNRSDTVRMNGHHSYAALFPIGAFYGSSCDVSGVTDAIVSYRARADYLYATYTYSSEIERYFAKADNCKSGIRTLSAREKYFLKRYRLHSGSERNVCLALAREKELLAERENIPYAAEYLENHLNETKAVLNIYRAFKPLNDFISITPKTIFMVMPLRFVGKESREILNDIYLLEYCTDTCGGFDRFVKSLNALNQRIKNSETFAKSKGLKGYEEIERNRIRNNLCGVRIKGNSAYVTIANYGFLTDTEFLTCEKINGKWKICRMASLRDISEPDRTVLLNKISKYSECKGKSQ